MVGWMMRWEDGPLPDLSIIGLTITTSTNIDQIFDIKVIDLHVYKAEKFSMTRIGARKGYAESIMTMA